MRGKNRLLITAFLLGIGLAACKKWDDHNQDWERKDQNMVVALKSLNNSKNVTFEFMNEVNYSIIT